MGCRCLELPIKYLELLLGVKYKEISVGPRSG